MAVLSFLIIILISCSPSMLQAQLQQSYKFKKLNLPSRGSESCAFDPNGGGPYTSLNDGRIVKYQGPQTGFTDFATTSAQRTKELCDGQFTDDRVELAIKCGRPIGLEFNQKTGDLYIADAFHGPMVVGPQGGLATPVCDGDGVPTDVPDAIDVDPVTGTIFYTDVGTSILKIRNLTEFILSGDTSGRLLKYDPMTKQRTVVLTGLAGPTGLAVSKDGTFVAVSEYVAGRIRKFWIKGPKANTSEVMVNLPGNPDNIKRTESGDFWVPVNIERFLPKKATFPLAQKFNSEGQILETVHFFEEYNDVYITEVHQHHAHLFVASVYADFVGVFKGVKCVTDMAYDI
ncbi:OLC1v1028049C1 [Oldenlandia corymbosa var. corymbosa]|uniref:OLC1v1028049C1 n=1 Tax=Oldenlandia corymbosa var. corymbosa TaxID=529605 RepID=A0AAV1CDR3_OLDCO|nr:OLC1v1028049C1 [Oldenlandia corymbosa var. corymbosa]